MDYERIKKYFAQENKSYPIVISGSLFLSGLVMILILSGLRWANRWLMYSLGVSFIFIAAVIYVIYSAIRIKDSEIDGLIPEIEKTFQTDFKNKFTETDVRKIKYEQLHGTHDQKTEPVFFGTYCFDSAEALHKRGADGKSRSSLYSLSGFLMKGASLCISTRRVSFVSDQAPDTLFAERHYEDLSEAKLTDTGSTGYSGVTPYRHLCVLDNAGETVASLPILADAAADEFIAEINSRIRHAKAQNQ